ncbi:AIR synthase-related protein [Liquorilactobacillus vini]|uniref:AIR synthase-related protein n=1 Tax=Liquorilactobacillus vini TaxID=238015 RepID=UPI00031EAD80|nr:AIR synthase-related protein [Liquorilactobacillus vini]
MQKLLTGSISGKLQDFDLASVTALLKKMLTAVQRGLTNSVHDLSEGGLAVAAAESAFATQFGLRLEVDLSDQQLFSETPGRFLVTVPAEKTAGFTDLLGSNAQLVGQVTAQKTLELKTLTGCYQLDLLQAEKLWEEAIPCLMKSKD